MKKIFVIGVVLVLLIFSFNLFAKNDVIAKFNGGTLTKKDVQILIDEIPAPFRKLVKKNSNFEKQALLLKLISMEYKNKKIDEDTLRKIELCKNRILLKKYFEDKLKNITVSEKEIKEYYEKHKKEYIQKNSFKFNLIVFNTEKEAKDVYNKIKKGEKFEKFTKGSFYKNLIPANNLPKVFVNNLIKLKNNEISKPFKFNKKYYIVKLIDKKKIPGKTFEQVKESIKQKLLAEKKKRERKKIEKELFKKYNVKFLK